MSLPELAGACGPDDGAGPSSAARNPVARIADAMLARPPDHDPAFLREQHMLHEDILARGLPLHPGPPVPQFAPAPAPNAAALIDEFAAAHPHTHPHPHPHPLHPRIGPHGQLLPPGLPPFPNELDAHLPPPLAHQHHFEQAFHQARHPTLRLHPPPQRPSPAPAPAPAPAPQPTLRLQPPAQPAPSSFVDSMRQRAEQRARTHFPGASEEHIQRQVDDFLSALQQDTTAPAPANWADSFARMSLRDTPAHPPPSLADQFAAEQPAVSAPGPSAAAADPLQAAFDAAAGIAEGTSSRAAEQKWADEFHEKLAADPDAWADDFSAFEDTFDADLRDFLGRGPDDTEYDFAENNPYLGNPRAMQIAEEHLAAGRIADAVLALEAVVQAAPENAQAWYTLGTTQAEADDDARAIAALRRCVESVDAPHEASASTAPEHPAPLNSSVVAALLELGVSYTNELNQSRALAYLRRWIDAHPVYGAIQPAVPASDPAASVEAAHGELLQRFLAASRQHPQDAELHIVLGVLHNLSREYEAAIEAFQVALRLRPDDYKLWNKLGATFANSSEAAEALRSYRRAVDIRPSFVRAWVNVGTAYANQASYQHAARYYLKALLLNRSANHVWSYLRTTMIALGREDLLPLVERRDIELFRKHFDF